MKIAYFLPALELSNQELVKEFPEWNAEKIFVKTGISSRRIASENETALDLAEQAAKRLFSKYNINPSSINFLVLCTQSSLYPLPSTSCLLQERLGLPNTCGAITIDQGCSGYVYGLSIAKGILDSGLVKNVLLVTSETYTKYLAKEDKSTRAIFGDGAAATFLDESDGKAIGAFSFGTDGAGAEKLIVRDGYLFMDGPDIFNFTLDIVPKTLDAVLATNSMTRKDVDLYVFHQANKFMLDTIRKVNQLPQERFYVNLETIGNTVSSTIPIALSQLETSGQLKAGMKIVLMGFGVGLSWAATVIKWREN